MTGLPTVPVYDLKVHPRDNELIAATHGRSFWVVDITPLQQMTRSAIASITSGAAHLYVPKPALQFTSRAGANGVTNGYGHQLWTTPSPQYGAEIVYRINTAPRPAAPTPDQAPAAGGSVTVTAAGGGGAPMVVQQGPGRQGGAGQARIIILNAANDTMATLTGPSTVGMHRVTWGFFPRFTPQPLTPSQKRDSVLRVRRIEFVFDSLKTAGVGADTVLNQIKRMFQTNNLAPLFQQGPGPGGAMNPNRPGEGPLVRPRTATTAPSPTEAPADLINRVFPNGVFQLQLMMTPPGVVNAPVGFGGGAFAEAPPGDYRVELVIGDQTLRRTLRVERPR
jgi:hypothetical protein